MNQEIKRRWIEALRSGHYKQGAHMLSRALGSEQYFCCLGVLCDVLNVPYVAYGDLGVRYYGQDGYSLYLPPEVQQAVDISYLPTVPARIVKEVVGGYESFDDNDAVALSLLNDNGVPFDKIADIIERAL